ncbi:MAG: DMT family transporter [Candidatus Diapherotrites archaeon]
MNKGMLLVLATAVVSGVSIFLNSFAVKNIDSFVFTTFKNSVVALLLVPLIIALKGKPCVILERKFLPGFLAIGLIGGSIPFFLYFYALSIIPATTAGFIHKTLFLWAAFFALLLIREKISKWFFIAAIFMLLGNYIMSQPKNLFGYGELIALAATALWALENVIAKKMLIKKEINGMDVALARMFYGSIFMTIGLLAFMPNSVLNTYWNFERVFWLIITAVLLLLYVSTYYNGLKYIEVHKAAGILLLAQPITVALSWVFGSSLKYTDLLGSALVVSGFFVLAFASIFVNKVLQKVPICTKAKH